MNPLLKILLKICGFIMVALGTLGIVIPGLPTTPFMIVAAFCFMKSSDRMYKWVTTNKLFGGKVKKFIDNRSIPLRGKIFSISAMWIMIIISMIFVIDKTWLYVLLSALGIGGTVVLLSIKTYKE